MGFSAVSSPQFPSQQEAVAGAEHQLLDFWTAAPEFGFFLLVLFLT